MEKRKNLLLIGVVTPSLILSTYQGGAAQALPEWTVVAQAAPEAGQRREPDRHEPRPAKPAAPQQPAHAPPAPHGAPPNAARPAPQHAPAPPVSPPPAVAHPLPQRPNAPAPAPQPTPHPPAAAGPAPHPQRAAPVAGPLHGAAPAPAATSSPAEAGRPPRPTTPTLGAETPAQPGRREGRVPGAPAPAVQPLAPARGAGAPVAGQPPAGPNRAPHGDQNAPVGVTQPPVHPATQPSAGAPPTTGAGGHEQQKSAPSQFLPPAAGSAAGQRQAAPVPTAPHPATFPPPPGAAQSGVPSAAPPYGAPPHSPASTPAAPQTVGAGHPGAAPGATPAPGAAAHDGHAPGVPGAGGRPSTPTQFLPPSGAAGVGQHPPAAAPQGAAQGAPGAAPPPYGAPPHGGPAGAPPGAPIGVGQSAPPVGLPPQYPPVAPQRSGSRIGPAGAAAIGAAAGLVGGFLLAQPGSAQRLDDVHRRRQQFDRDGLTVIQEPGRTIVRESDRVFIRHDENERFRELGGDLRVERRGAEFVSVYPRPDGSEVVTVTDENGVLLRRYRRFPNGREIVIIDNSFRGPPRSFDEDVVVLPPPPVELPRERYVVDYGRADERLVYETLTAPPLAPLPRRYTLDEVRYSPAVRAYTRSVDIDTINFDTGSWTVAPDQAQRLAVIGKALNEAIRRNPSEVFLVEGHTDAVGSDVDNLSLSDRRAQSVAAILTRDFSVPPENLTTQGYGEQYPKAQTQGPSRENRRVTLRRITPLLNGPQQTGLQQPQP